MESARTRPRGLRRRVNSADILASALRGRILSGEVPDGGMLPTQQALTEEFGVSKAVVREASRILETEGLLTVQRGNVGGAMVHVPRAANVAYTLGLVLHSRGTRLEDVRSTIELVEPLCAGLCASRPDRMTTVVPALVASNDELRRCVARGDGEGATRAARSWHEAIAQNAGLESMTVLIGALATVWSSHIHSGVEGTRDQGVALNPESSEVVVKDHQKIVDLIVDGDQAGATEEARAHLAGSPRIHQSDAYLLPQEIDAEVVRDQLFG